MERTMFETYVFQLKEEYMLNPEMYEEKIIKNKKTFLKQYYGKINIEKSFTDDGTKKWITFMRNKYGQELADSFISYYILYNICNPTQHISDKKDFGDALKEL